MCHSLTVHGDEEDENGERKSEILDVWCRDPVKCVHKLIGNPEFWDSMHYCPEKLFTSDDKLDEDRIINEMWTGDWWWDLQVCIV